MSGVSAIFTINNSITRCFSHFIKICYPLCRELPKQEDLCLQKTPDMSPSWWSIFYWLVPFHVLLPYQLFTFTVLSLHSTLLSRWVGRSSELTYILVVFYFCPFQLLILQVVQYFKASSSEMWFSLKFFPRTNLKLLCHGWAFACLFFREQKKLCQDENNLIEEPKTSKVIILSGAPFFLNMLVSLSCCLVCHAHLRPSSFVSAKTNQQNLTTKCIMVKILTVTQLMALPHK